MLNRANARLPIFESDGDYEAFEAILAEGVARFQPRLLAYCLMPNHWHLVVWPLEDGVLSRFTGWVTLTHTQRWHAFRRSAGSGHLYQGRFKSFPVQEEDHFYTLCRYVERNALRARLVERAENWRWCSLWRMTQPDRDLRGTLSRWPLPRPRNWLAQVNAPQTELEEMAMQSARFGAAARWEKPFGPSKRHGNWGWRAPFAPAAGREWKKTVPDTNGTVGWGARTSGKRRFSGCSTAARRLSGAGNAKRDGKVFQVECSSRPHSRLSGAAGDASAFAVSFQG